MIGAPSTPAAPASAPAAARTPVCTARGLWPVAASISGSSAAARTAAPIRVRVSTHVPNAASTTAITMKQSRYAG